MQDRASRGRWPAIAVLVFGLAVLVSVVSLSWFRAHRPDNQLRSGLEAYARGDWGTASVLAREQLKRAGDDHEALRLLARSSVRLGRDSTAMAIYKQLGSSAMAPDDLYLLGISLGRTGNPKGSVEVWQQALKADPDHPATLDEMIQVHLRADRFHAARAAASRLAQHPDWKDRALALLGQIEMNRENPGKAADLWQQVLAYKPTVRGNWKAPLINRKELARAMLRAQRPAEARTQLEMILASGPDPEASWLLSRAYLQEDAIPGALAASKAAGSFSEENPTVHEPARLTGAMSCAPCHSEKYQAQQNSRHARTFHRVTEMSDLALPQGSIADPADSRVTHQLQRIGDDIEQKTHTVSHLYRAVLDYAFGSGDRGKTMIGHDKESQSFELRLSVYHETTAQAKWDVTSGHAPHPSSDQGFLGMPLTEDAVRRCFSCHVTSPGMFLEARTVQKTDRAIGCEKCHGPGGNHLLAVAAKFPDLAIARPSLASGPRVVKICAECHSPRGKQVERDDPTSVRFQGTTLTWSRCYTESKDSLDCVTCHDPHRDAVIMASHYEAKCLHCHAGSEVSDNSSGEKQPRKLSGSEMPSSSTCPVNPIGNCLPCHMPKVKGVVPHSTFTDHFIRVHPENSTASSK